MFVFKKPRKSIYLNAANEANHTMKSGHDMMDAQQYQYHLWLHSKDGYEVLLLKTLGTLKDWPRAF